MFNVLLPTETIPNNSSSFPMDHMFYFVIRTDNDGFSCVQIFLQTPCVLQPQCQATCELPHTSNQNLSSDYRSEGRNSLYAPCVHKRSMTMILEHGLLLFLLLILLLLSLSCSSHCLNSILLITCKALAFGIKSSQSMGWWDTRSVRNFMIRRCMTANSVPNFALALYVKFGVACRSSALHVEECVEISELYVPFGVVCATFGAVYQTLRAEFWRGGPSGTRARARARARTTGSAHEHTRQWVARPRATHDSS